MNEYIVTELYGEIDLGLKNNLIPNEVYISDGNRISNADDIESMDNFDDAIYVVKIINKKSKEEIYLTDFEFNRYLYKK